MQRKTLTLLLVGAAALAVLAAGSLLTPTVDASGGCGPCGGATRSVTGNGSGNSCAEALDAAEDDAIIKSFAGYPNCSPCQTSSGPQSCSTPSCYPGPCPPNSYNASSTLYYKCQACDIGPLDPLP